jgi:hypothetical protein
VEQVRPRQELPPPPPLRAEQGASHPIRSPCYTPHESEDARGVSLGVLRQVLRHRGAGSRLRFQQRTQERPRHRLAVQVGAQDSGLATFPAPLFPPLYRVPCHNPQNSLKTSLAGVGAGASGGSCGGSCGAGSLPRFLATFFPTSSGSTGPLTADGLSGAAGVVSLMGGRLRCPLVLRLAALRVDFAAHPFPPLLVLLPQDGEPHLDGCPEDMRLRIPRTPCKFPNPTCPISRKTHRDLFPFRLEFARHAEGCRLLPPLASVDSLSFSQPTPRERFRPPIPRFSLSPTPRGRREREKYPQRRLSEKKPMGIMPLCRKEREEMILSPFLSLSPVLRARYSERESLSFTPSGVKTASAACGRAPE